MSRILVFRGDGTSAAGDAGCERYWTVCDGRLLIAGDDGRLTMDLVLVTDSRRKGGGWCVRGYAIRQQFLWNLLHFSLTVGNCMDYCSATDLHCENAEEVRLFFGILPIEKIASIDS
jgi:hypothetical protein